LIELQQYTGQDGRSVFAKWFQELNLQAAAKVTGTLEKIALGNFSNVEPVGEGVSECKVDWGPGYRIYLGKDGEFLVILLGGGTKKRQSADIAIAKANWAEYKKRKRRGSN
jgi:putative addiction module killer protein